MSRANPSPEDLAARAEHARRRKEPRWETPPTPDAELLGTCRAIRARGHIHDLDEVLREKGRVLVSRRWSK
jgi:hypothetical protein